MIHCLYLYVGIDHDKIYSTQLQNNVSQHEESVTQEDAVGCHIDTQLNKLNLRNDTAGKNRYFIFLYIFIILY